MVALYIPIDNFTMVPEEFPLKTSGTGSLAWIFTVKSEEEFLPISPFNVITFTISTPLFSSVSKADDKLSVLGLVPRSIWLDLPKLDSVKVSFLNFESNSEPKQVNVTREAINKDKKGSKSNFDVNFINNICIVILKRVQLLQSLSPN